jgi:hypothetical protein
MRVLVIHPGHAFSTSDVHDGLVWGLQAAGMTVYSYPLMDDLISARALIRAGELAGFVQADSIDVHMWATRGIPGVVMSQQITHVIAVTGSNVPWQIPVTLRRGGVHLTLLCTESPYLTRTREANDARLYDVVLTHERRATGLLEDYHGRPAHYLPHAYHPARHTPAGPRAPACDVFFCGTRFPERATLLDGVDWGGIAFTDRTVSVTPGDDPALALAQAIPNTETASHYRSAAISLNHHRTSANLLDRAHITDPAESLGPRTYEIAACRGFQLCDDRRPELDDIFQGSVPTYDPTRPETLERQIRHYLRVPSTREALAYAQHQAVQGHGWDARARVLLDILASHPARGMAVAVASIPTLQEA